MNTLNNVVYIFGTVIVVISGYFWMAEKGMIEKTEFYHGFFKVMTWLVS